MDILDKTARNYKNDVRMVLGAKAALLPDNDARLDDGSPFILQAESTIKQIVTDWAAVLAADATKYQLYWAVVYSLACLLWPGIFEPEVIREKTPDFEVQRHAGAIEAAHKAICDHAGYWLAELGYSAAAPMIDVLEGSADTATETRGNGL